jgi:RimJ/RimL family protein N-acetyltransferase
MTEPTGPAPLRLLPCPPALRERAAEVIHSDPVATVEGKELTTLLPPGLQPGRTWPQHDDLVGLAMGGLLVALGEEVIGGCGAKGVPDADGCQEIGYGLAPAYRRRGLGAASVALLVAALCSDPGVRSVSAEVLPGNEPSWRLLVSLGFVRDPAGDRGGHHRYLLA